MAQGATYKHHYCTVPLCCPSRTNLWTGRCAHNTNVTSNGLPGGGYDKFVQQGLNDDWLFPWMQNAGYQTYFVGKLLNGFEEKNYNKPFPNGFNGTDFLCGKGGHSQRVVDVRWLLTCKKERTITTHRRFSVTNTTREKFITTRLMRLGTIRWSMLAKRQNQTSRSSW